MLALADDAALARLVIATLCALGSRLRTASAWLPAASADAHHGDGAAGDQPVLKPSVLFIAKVLQHDTPIVAHTSGIRRF